MLNGNQNYHVLSRIRDDPNLFIRQYKKRKTHTKTRSGCLTCRAKKVKCDESRPVCARCERNGRACLYSAGISHPAPEIRLPNGSSFPSLTAVTLSSNPAWNHPSNGTPTTHLIQHLLTHWTVIFHIPCDAQLLSMSQANPLVENTMLAISACHLRHAAPDVLQHRVAEYFHQSQILGGFRRLLNVPTTTLGQSDADSLMLCATLLNMITFALSADQRSGKLTSKDRRLSSVFEFDTQHRGWLDLQIGLRPLLRSMVPFLESTINLLAPIFFGGDRKNWGFEAMSHAAGKIPHRWMDFFELKEFDSGGCDCQSNERGEIFRAPLAMVAQLRALEPVPFNVYKSIQFLAKIQHQFRGLLVEGDSKALWLFGYWLGLLCRYDDVWWCKERTRRDYTAICALLQERNLTEQMGPEGRFWTEMMMELEAVTVRGDGEAHGLLHNDSNRRSGN